MTNNWFAHCHTLDEARAEYRRLCFVHHPDYGGDTLMMQAINVAYEQFKQALNVPRRAQDASRRHWHKPPRQRPDDVPPTRSRPQQREADPQPVHSRDYFKSMWNHAPWHAVGPDHLACTIWQHTITIFRHPDPKFAGAWFVVLDDVFSPYFYDNRREAEQAAFDLVYEKVKYLDI